MEVVLRVLLIIPLVALTALSVWNLVYSLNAGNQRMALGWAGLFVLDMFLAFVLWGLD
jgi:hypothetical protein